MINSIIPTRYSKKNVKKVIQDPRLAIREITRPSWTIQDRLCKLLFKWIHEGETCSIMEKDWDNMIILDACRHDYFEQRNKIEGELKCKISAGSQSWEFMKAHFMNAQHHDTVYVTSNPYVHRLSDSVFFKIENVLNKWNSKIEVVEPESVTEQAVETYHENGDKRLIVHYMQPHTPWLGQTATKIRERLSVKGNDKNFAKEAVDERSGNFTYFELVKRNEISHEEMESAYIETLDIVLRCVENLIEKISGKTVITADHGEGLGEWVGTRRIYGHPSNMWKRELRFVPWLIVNGKERRNITADTPKGRSYMDSDVINERLQSLGYK